MRQLLNEFQDIERKERNMKETAKKSSKFMQPMKIS